MGRVVLGWGRLSALEFIGDDVIEVNQRHSTIRFSREIPAGRRAFASAFQDVKAFW